ncbi:colanic acid biosynthesis glycosyltransferase WcaI, partial [Mycobacterium tuberculosis]
LGWVRGERVRRFALAAERWLMRKFDRVSTISSTMLAKARDKGVDESRLVLFPNWVDVEAIRPVKRGALAAGASAQGYR